MYNGECNLRISKINYNQNIMNPDMYASAKCETQRRHHHKSQTGVSVTPQKDSCPSKIKKKSGGSFNLCSSMCTPVGLDIPCFLLIAKRACRKTRYENFNF